MFVYDLGLGGGLLGGGCGGIVGGNGGMGVGWEGFAYGFCHCWRRVIGGVCL